MLGPAGGGRSDHFGGRVAVRVAPADSSHLSREPRRGLATSRESSHLWWMALQEGGGKASRSPCKPKAPLTRPSLVTLRPACHTQVNTSLQLRWFVLSDDAAEGVGGTLRYYEGRNGVTRVLKGEIRISPADVSMVRTYTHEANGQEKCLGVRLTTPARVWELVGYKSDAEVRQWAELLSARIRHRVHRPTISHIADSTAAQQARGAHAPSHPPHTCVVC